MVPPSILFTYHTTRLFVSAGCNLDCSSLSNSLLVFGRPTICKSQVSQSHQIHFHFKFGITILQRGEQTPFVVSAISCLLPSLLSQITHGRNRSDQWGVTTLLKRNVLPTCSFALHTRSKRVFLCCDILITFSATVDRSCTDNISYSTFMK